MRFYEVATTGCAVGFAEDHVGMELGLAIRKRDVAKQGEDLNLFGNWNPFIVTFSDLKKSEHRVAERANRGELAGCKPLFASECFESLNHLIASIEHDRKGLGSFVDEFGFHSWAANVRLVPILT